MSNTKFQFLPLAVILFLCCAQLGSALQCFQCTEEKGGDGICVNDQKVKHASVACTTSCIKHTLAPIDIGGMKTNEIIARVCADPSYCTIGTAFLEQRMSLKTRSCTECKTDYCNAGSATIPSMILVGALALKYYFL